MSAKTLCTSKERQRHLLQVLVAERFERIARFSQILSEKERAALKPMLWAARTRVGAPGASALNKASEILLKHGVLKSAVHVKAWIVRKSKGEFSKYNLSNL